MATPDPNPTPPLSADPTLSELVAHFTLLLRQPPPETYAFGQIWTTRSTGRVDAHLPNRLVVLLGPAGQLAEPVTGGQFPAGLYAVPVAPDLTQQTVQDMLVRPAESPLAFAFLLELWLPLALLPEQLGACVGTLAPLAQAALQLNFAGMGEGGLAAYLRANFRPPALPALLEPASRLGPPLGDLTDPRWPHRAREIDAINRLRQPYRAALAASGATVTPIDATGLLGWLVAAAPPWSPPDTIPLPSLSPEVN